MPDKQTHASQDVSTTFTTPEVSFVRYLDTLLGPLWVWATEHGICNVGFGTSIKEKELKHLQRYCVPEPVVVEDGYELLDKAVAQLLAYFDCRLRVFSLDLDVRGTPFQLAVWDRIQQIPYGETVTYGEIATYLDSPHASQAVGQATGANPVSIVVPCHRVVGHDGRLTGYGAGLERKSALLEMEQAGLQLRLDLV